MSAGGGGADGVDAPPALAEYGADGELELWPKLDGTAEWGAEEPVMGDDRTGELRTGDTRTGEPESSLSELSGLATKSPGVARARRAPCGRLRAAATPDADTGVKGAALADTASVGVGLPAIARSFVQQVAGGEARWGARRGRGVLARCEGE